MAGRAVPAVRFNDTAPRPAPRRANRSTTSTTLSGVCSDDLEGLAAREAPTPTADGSGRRSGRRRWSRRHLRARPRRASRTWSTRPRSARPRASAGRGSESTVFDACCPRSSRNSTWGRRAARASRSQVSERLDDRRPRVSAACSDSTRRLGPAAVRRGPVPTGPSPTMPSQWPVVGVEDARLQELSLAGPLRDG